MEIPVIGPFAARVLRSKMIDKRAAAKVGEAFADLFVGARAFDAGKSPVSCPFVLDTDDWHRWYAGWLHGTERRRRR
jgi:hypothetical protein